MMYIMWPKTSQILQNSLLEKKKNKMVQFIFPSPLLQKNIKEVQQEIRVFKPSFSGYLNRIISRTSVQTFNDISSTSLLYY